MSECINPSCHRYERPWFARDVTTRVAMVTTDSVAVRHLHVNGKVKVKLPPSCREGNIREAEVQHYMHRSG